MMYHASSDSPEAPRRWEYRVHPNDSLSTLLDRIRETSSSELFLDISHHAQLRQDGALRRTLAASAGELGKRVTFSLTDPRASRTPSPSAQQGMSHLHPSKKQEVTDRTGKSKTTIPLSVIPESDERRLHIPEGHIGISLPKVGASGKRIAITFAFFTGILATLAALFLAPRAEIMLEPNVEPVTTDVMIRLSTHASAKDVSGGILPARIITHDEVIERTFRTEHVVERGDRAHGIIDIVNRTGSTQRIKSGSRLSTSDGIVFRTQTAVTVPPNGSTAVTVNADVGGTSGNLQSGDLSFVALPHIRSVLFGRVPSPLTGGTEKRMPLLNEEEVRRASEVLLGEARTVLQQKLSAKRSALFFARDEFFRAVVLETSTQEPLGQEIPEFHLRARVRGEYFSVSEQEIAEMVRAVLSLKHNDEKTLGAPVSLSNVQVEHVRWEEGLVDLAVHVENVLHERIEIPHVAERLAGRTKDGAEEYLRNLPGMKDVRITLRPFWVKRVPTISRNIMIQIAIPEKGS